MEDSAREAWHRLRGRSDDPITVHAEMNVKDTPILEVNELMLPSPLDRTYARTAQRTQGAARQPSSESRVQHAGAHQRSALDRRAEESRGAFDFGKLRHELSR